MKRRLPPVIGVEMVDETGVLQFHEAHNWRVALQPTATRLTGAIERTPHRKLSKALIIMSLCIRESHHYL